MDKEKRTAFTHFDIDPTIKRASVFKPRYYDTALSQDFSRINFLRLSTTVQRGDSHIESVSTIFGEDEYDLLKSTKVTEEEFPGFRSKFDPDLQSAILKLAGTWRNRLLEPRRPWEDKDHEVVKVKPYDDLTLTPDELNGLLTERIIESCSDYFDEVPEVDAYVLTKCVLSNKKICDISALGCFRFLQYLDLSKNRVCCLKPLNNLPFLMYLNASSNCLKEALNFRAPLNLMFVNLSNNNLSCIRDLSDFWTLIALDLSHNQIEEISGLENLKYLEMLNLSFNWISSLCGLNNLISLRYLNLYSNIINDFEIGPDVGLKMNFDLRTLNLSRNYVTSVRVVEGVKSLQFLDLSDNKIEFDADFLYLKGLNLLYLDLCENPVRTHPRYQDACLSYLRKLTVLDGDTISAETRVACEQRFEEMIHEYTENDTQHIILSNMNPPCITKSVVPYTEPPRPLIVFVGPPSSLKGFLVDLICQLYPKNVARGVNHTTRPKSDGEYDGEQYHFVDYETFKSMLRKGLFLTTTEYFGHLYGFAQSEIDNNSDGRKVIVTHSDLNGGILLRDRGFRPTLILTLPKSEATHLKMLRRKYFLNILDSCFLQSGTNRLRTSESLTRVKNYSHRAMVNEIVKNVKKVVEKIEKDAEVVKSAATITCPMEGSDFSLTHPAECDCEALRAERELYESQSINEYQKRDLGKFNIDGLIAEGFLTSKDSAANEEQTEFLEKMFDDVIRSRRQYLRTHWKNLGLFSQVFFTDEMDESLAYFKTVLKNCINNYHRRLPVCQVEHDPKEHSIVKNRMEWFRYLMSPTGLMENENLKCGAGRLELRKKDSFCSC